MIDTERITRGATRGVIAAMAMSGMRRVTTGFGLLEQEPPDTVAEHAPIVSALLARVKPENREEVIELAHWAYGAAGGAAFAAMVAPHTRSRWAGPVYGLALWAFFETGLVPALGLGHGSRSVTSRVAAAADHVLYGVVVGSSPWPHRV